MPPRSRALAVVPPAEDDALVPATVPPRVAAAAAFWGGMLSMLRAFPIDSSDAVNFASDYVAKARAAAKELDDERTFFTRPMLEAKRRLDAHYKGPLDVLAKIQSEVRAAIGAYTIKVEAERRAKIVESAASIAAGVIPTTIIAPPALAEAPRVSVSEYWDYEVTEPDLVRRDLCSPDHDKIKAVLGAYGPDVTALSMAGIRIFRAARTVVR